MRRPSPLLLLLSLAPACTGGENLSDSTEGELTSGLATDDASSSGDGSATSTGDDPTGGTTSGAPTTTGEPATSTTGDASTGDPTDATTGSTGSICDVGTVNCACDQGMCQDGLVCTNDVCVPGLTCMGDVEPDNSEPEATALGEVTDDDTETLMAEGVITGLIDVDWYSYHGVDTAFHVSEPTVKVTSSATLRICQFIECDNGGAVMTEITCPAGTQSALSGALRPGCCGGATFTISDFNCPGSDENLKVFVRIDKPMNDECVDYSLTVHY